MKPVIFIDYYKLKSSNHVRAKAKEMALTLTAIYNFYSLTQNEYILLAYLKGSPYPEYDIEKLLQQSRKF